MGPAGSQFMLLLLLMGVFYFLIIRPQQKRSKDHREMLAALKKGDHVYTSGGLVGRVAAVTDQVVSLEVADKVRVRVLRNHVAGRHAGEAGGGGSEGESN